jgi:type IV pilus assembly protein PilM
MASIIDAITSPLKSMLGGGGPKSVLGIDIGSSSIKMVQLSLAKGTAVLETYGEIALGPYAEHPVGKVVKLPPEKLSEAMLDLMKEANITSNKAGIAIPFSASLISILDLPKVDGVQLKRMIPIEARKYIPVPVSEVTLDWFVIPKDDSEQDAFDRVEKETMLQKRGQEVLLAAIHNETLRNYQTTMETAGISVSFFEIEIFSAIRSALGAGVAPVMVVDIGAATSKIYVVERGIVRASHLVNVGSQYMTETMARALNWPFEKSERMKREWGMNDSNTYSREENEQMHQALLSTLNRVFSDVNRVLLSYGKRYNKNVSSVVFTGGGASLPGLERYAKEQLNAEIVIADPFSKVEAPAFLADVLRQIGPGFSVAVGLALRKLRQS